MDVAIQNRQSGEAGKASDENQSVQEHATPVFRQEKQLHGQVRPFGEPVAGIGRDNLGEQRESSI